MSNTIPASTLEKFTTFGDLLRFLRRRVGITQVELSIAVGYSDAQISRLEQNLRLPDIPTIQARFVPALDLEDEPRAVARLLELAAQVRREDAPGPGLCPYKGLNYFDETDADRLFAGREALTARLAERVLSLASSGDSGQARFLAIVGASGSGKSSLVRAGLVPTLRWNKTSASWPIQVLIPTAHPLESLAASLTQENGSVATTASLMDDLAREPRSLSIFIQRLLRAARVSHFLLVVDQFEELFALCRSEAERTAFIDNLLTACAAGGPALLVITLRADFYAACASYPCLREALARQQEYIGAMNDEELRRAIEEPARRGHWKLEPGLADLLLHDVGHEPGALPLLSHALLETWQRRRGRTLTLSGYTSSGGVRGAIAETAEAVFADQFTSKQRLIARRIFLRLTELSNETAAGETRRRAAFDELILKPEEAAATRSVLKALADARLITTSQDSVEVAHEALIREWPTLRGWIEDDRESLRLHRHLTQAAQEWQAAGDEPDLLYRGARLAQVREWAAANADEMNLLEQQFLAASVEVSEREAAEREAQRQRELEAAKKLAETEEQRAEEQARSAGQLRKRAVYLTAALVIALGMALVALFFGGQARQAAIAAESERRLSFARELTSEAINNLDVDPELSILLSMQAISVTYATDGTWTAEAEDALRQSLEASRLLLNFHGHSDRLSSITYSPDGKRLATASGDGTVKIWDPASGQVLLSITTKADRGWQGIAFSPDGARLVTPGEKGTAVVWDAATGKALLTLHGHTDGVVNVAFSPDGRRLVTASQDGTAKIWDLATGRPSLNLKGHFAGVNHAAFSPDGKRVATASDDGTVIVWDTATGQAQFTLRGDTGSVSNVVFSPDGARLATSNEDKTARIWDAISGKELLTLRGHTDWVSAAAYSPDGSRLATAGYDGKVKVWNAATGQELLTLSGHTGAVAGLAFSPDCDRTPGGRLEQCGTRLATASLDGTARVWDTSFSREWLAFSVPGLSSGEFSLEGDRLATGYPDGTIKIWAIPTTVQETSPHSMAGAVAAQELLTLRAHLGVVKGLAFSPDGSRLASAGEDQTVIIWDAASGDKLRTLRGHTSWVSHVDFSPDGRRLASISRDPALILWDAETGRALRTRSLSLAGWGYSLDYSPDGRRLAIAIGFGARVDDAETGDLLLDLTGHKGYVQSVTFSPDGKQLATASEDGSGIVWDAGTGQALLTLRGHIGPVNNIAFSPDGSRLATAGQDGSVKLWDAATGQEKHTFYGFDDAVMDVAFSSDGKRLLTGTEHGMVRVYLLQIEDLMDLAARRLRRGLTAAECQQYLHRSPEQCGEEIVASPLELTPKSTTQTSPARAPGSKGKICELIDNSGAYEKFVSQGAYKGLQTAAASFGWEPDLLETQEVTDTELGFKRLTQSGCILIVAPTGSNYAGAIKDAFEANPAQKTLVIDWPFDTPLDNLWNQTYATDQAAFLAGYAAAAVSKTGKVATFGGIQIPAVIVFMDGFALGVDYYNQENGTQVELLGWDVAKGSGLFTDNFFDLEVGRRMGEKLMDQGADVILPVAGQLSWGAAAAVKERGNALIIGVDFDWAASNPEYADYILTSILKRVDVSVASAVQAAVDGTFTGGVHTGTLENGGVGLAPFYNLDGLVSPQVKADLEQIKQEIIAGKIQTQP